MNTEYIPFPTEAKRFHLRSDFPDELCFSDFATSRAVRRQIETAVYCERDFPAPVLDAYDPDLCESYRRSRFFIYCGMGVKGMGVIAPFVTDGKTWMPTLAEGLYKEMLERAGKAFGAPDKVLVFPPRPENPKWAGWLYPANVVLHDTAHNSAAILPFDTAFAYLEKYNK